ncbi:MAG: TIGR00725 family protein [Actinomycetota bacterium]|nr:TIGR00725 family protein [Actinomycetota bacterium]
MTGTSRRSSFATPIRVPYIAVIGSALEDAGELVAAEEVGRRLARRGACVVCGGLGGVMQAACRGAKAAAGTTIGILPGEDRSEANAFVDFAVATGLGEARNTVVVISSDAVIAVGGGFGTLSEMGFALKVGRPVVGLDTWELSARGVASGAVVRATSPADAVERALELALGP